MKTVFCASQKPGLDTEILGKKAAILASIETGLGSIIHGFKIPMGGHFLALNQAYFLTRAAIETGDKRSAGIISSTVAILKSLSPAGQKLTPMLAISVQGQLFGFGTFLFGNGLLGHLIGTTMLSIWGFVQPLGFYLLVFGSTITAMVDYYLKELNKVFPVSRDQVIHVLLGIVGFQILLGMIIVFLAHFARGLRRDQFEAWAIARSRKLPSKRHRSENSFLGAIKDVFQPLFLISITMMVFFSWFSSSIHAVEIWLILRPIALAYLFFLAVRLFPIEALVVKLQKRNPKISKTLFYALEKIKGDSASKSMNGIDRHH